jgi:hypothetical protein
MKSKTLREEPRIEAPVIDALDPIFTKLLTESEEPRDVKSNTLMALPILPNPLRDSALPIST